MSKKAERSRNNFQNAINTLGAIGSDGLDRSISEIAAVASYIHYSGRILHAGVQNSAGVKNYFVSFQADDGTSRAGEWPKWAYSVARDALLHGKRVQLVADGTPDGPNLLWIAIDQAPV